MDPLSVAASIIAVVGAADQAVSVLKRLLSLAHARDDVCQLLNEISDLEIFLSSLLDASKSLQQTKTQNVAKDVPRLVERAEVAVKEFHDFVYLHLLSSKSRKDFSASSLQQSSPIDKGSKPSYLGFALKRGKLPEIKDRVKSLQMTLSATLAAVNLTQLSNLSLNVERIALHVERLQPADSVSPTVMEHPIRSTNNANYAAPAQKPRAQQGELSSSDSKDLTLLQDTIGAASKGSRDSILRFDLSSQGQTLCDPTCLCQCHRVYSTQTPRPLKPVVGQLFLSYAGRPELRTTSCDIFNCRKKTTSGIKISYYFPEWFLGRTIWFISLWKDLNGIGATWTLRVPNVISFADPIWLLLDEGKCKEVVARFESGENAANDVDPTGRTLLDFCMWRPNEIISMLYRNGARLDSETTGGVSNAYIAYTRLIPLKSRRAENETYALGDLLGGTDDIDTLNFSGLHNVVTGLLDIPPLQYLKSHPEEINAVDIGSVTPLMWAIQCGNVDYAMTLLDFKADPCVRDCRGGTALHYACRLNANSKVLRLIRRLLSMKAQVNAQDQKGKTPLIEAAGKGMRKIVEILLKNGADVRIADFFDQPALLWAIQSASTNTLLLLIKHGARADFISSHGEDVVLFTARYASISAMQALAGLPNLKKGKSGAVDGLRLCPWCSLIEDRPYKCPIANRPKTLNNKIGRVVSKEEMEAFGTLMMDRFEDYHKLADDGTLMSRSCDAILSSRAFVQDAESSPLAMPGAFQD